MKSKKAFTLLELLVAMAVIAVLISLAVYGILQVQKNSRETQRRKALEDINIGINEYYSLYGEYPENITFVGTEATIGSDPDKEIIVPLKSAAKATASTNDPTTTKLTQYFFGSRDDGYQLAFCREDKGIENAGTSPVEAEENVVCAPR